MFPTSSPVPAGPKPVHRVTKFPFSVGPKGWVVSGAIKNAVAKGLLSSPWQLTHLEELGHLTPF